MLAITGPNSGSNKKQLHSPIPASTFKSHPLENKMPHPETGTESTNNDMSTNSNPSNNAEAEAEVEVEVGHQKQQQEQQSYISPSDTIMSPTTKRLAEMKGRRFAYVFFSLSLPPSPPSQSCQLCPIVPPSSLGTPLIDVDPPNRR